MLGPEYQRVEVVQNPLYRTVTETLPIAHLLSSVTKGDEKQAQNLIGHASQTYSDPYERWEAVRYNRANLITGSFIVDENTGLTIPHTGWEGYFVGSGMTPEEIVRVLASIGAKTARSMEIMYPRTYSMVKHVLDTGRGYSMEALREIEICFKSIKARFDGREYPPEAEVFRRQTSELVQKLPPVQMLKGADGITQILPIPNGNDYAQTAAISTSLRLPYKESEGIGFMAKFPIVGQPLIRTMLEVS